MNRPKVAVPLGRNELLTLLTALSQVYTELSRSSSKEGRKNLQDLMEMLCYKLDELKQLNN